MANDICLICYSVLAYRRCIALRSDLTMLLADGMTARQAILSAYRTQRSHTPVPLPSLSYHACCSACCPVSFFLSFLILARPLLIIDDDTAPSVLYIIPSIRLDTFNGTHREVQHY